MTLIKPTRRQDQTIIVQNDSNITVSDLLDNQIGIDQTTGNINVVKIVDNVRQISTISNAQQTKFGDIVNNSYTEFEADGTLKMNGNATVYEDVFTTIASGKISAVNQPSWSTFTANTNAYTFAVNDYIDLATIEVPHSYKEGSNIELHLHFANNGTDTTDRNVKFTVYYTYALPDSGSHQFSVESSFTAETTISSTTLDKSAFYLSLGTIVDPNMKIGTQIKTRIKRVSSTGTAPTANPFLGMLGFHYISDTIGSRSMPTK